MKTMLLKITGTHEDGSIQFESEDKKVLIGIYEDRISLFYIDAFSNAHLMPNVPQDYLIDFLKGMWKNEKDTVGV